MINITEFYFSEDLKTITLEVTSPSEVDSVTMYVGDGYTGDPKDLSSKLLPGNTGFAFTITATDLGLPEGEPLSGIFIAVITNTDPTPDIKEAGILSDYLLSICLANKIIQQNQEKDLNETTFLFLLIEATKSYMTEEQLEQALSSYARAESICKADPENYNTDILPCGEGTGCWIINGVYIVKK